MVGLIDADSIIHILSYKFSVNEKPLKKLNLTEEELTATLKAAYDSMDKAIVLQSLDAFIKSILMYSKSTSYLGFLGARSGSHTFRHDFAKTKPYKGTRGESSSWVKYWKPIMAEHMVNVWKFHELYEIEADDACTIFQTVYGDNSVICSPDKDLRQIKGWNYNYLECKLEYITEEKALYNLYYQLLVGDSTDNITGCKGVGKNKKAKVGADGKNLKVMVKGKPRNVYYVPTDANGVPTAGAPKILYGLSTERELKEATIAAYKSKGHSMEYMREQYVLIYMLRNHVAETKDLVPIEYCAKSTEFVQQGPELPKLF